MFSTFLQEKNLLTYFVRSLLSYYINFTPLTTGYLFSLALPLTFNTRRKTPHERLLYSGEESTSILYYINFTLIPMYKMNEVFLSCFAFDLSTRRKDSSRTTFVKG